MRRYLWFVYRLLTKREEQKDIEQMKKFAQQKGSLTNIEFEREQLIKRVQARGHKFVFDVIGHEKYAELERDNELDKYVAREREKEQEMKVLRERSNKIAAERQRKEREEEQFNREMIKQAGVYASMKAYKDGGHTKRVIGIVTEMGSRLTMPTSADYMAYCSNVRSFPQLVWIDDCQLLGGNPPPKRKYRQKKRRGPPRRKRQMVKASQLGLRNPPLMTHYPTSITDLWRYEQIIESDGAGSFYAFFNLRNPTKALNGSGTYSRAQSFADLYDEFKPLQLTVIVDYLNLSTLNGFTRIAVDQDSLASPPYGTNDIRDNETMREFSGTNQIAYQCHITPLAAGTYNGSPSVIFQRGWYDFNTPPDEGVVVVAGDRYTPGIRLVNITLTMRVCMRRRRTINAAKDETTREQEREKALIQKLKRMSV